MLRIPLLLLTHACVTKQGGKVMVERMDVPDTGSIGAASYDAATYATRSKQTWR